MLILGIETSCDETGVALYSPDKGIIGHLLNSQMELHRAYGGVVPEIASRNHVTTILPLVDSLLKKSHIALSDIAAVAYTSGPGLAGSLFVGAGFAHGLAYVLNIPIVAVHHMEAHLLSAMLEDPAPTFPFIALLVSGGHTMLVMVKQAGNYQIIGKTRDDAAGETLDKIATMLGLPFPGGAMIEKLSYICDKSRFVFTRPMIHPDEEDFSFSGLKTQVANTIKQLPSKDLYPEIAKALLDAITDIMVVKCERAMQKYGVKNLVAAGGVTANQQLRQQLNAAISKIDGKVYFPRIEWCTDNGAMIAYAGYLRWKHKNKTPSFPIIRPRWSLEELTPLL